MKKILSLFVKIWSVLKKIGVSAKNAFKGLLVLIGRARKGEALELHPLVGIWAKRILNAIFVLAVLVFCYGVAFGIGIYKYKINDPATRVAAKIIPYPAAIVQGRIVTMDEYFKNYQYVNNFYSQTQQTNVNYEQIKSQILDQLIGTELMKSQAKRFSVRVKDSDINNAYGDVIVQNGGEEEVKKVLHDLYGLNVKEFKKLISDQILEQKLQETVPVQVRAQHILIRINEGATEAQINEAKGRADQALNEIKGGADFGETAKKLSEDTGSASNGGDLEFFSRGQMDPEFEKVAFSTPVGQVSEPFKTQFGWHIVKVTERKGIIDQSFADWVNSLKTESLIINLF